MLQLKRFVALGCLGLHLLSTGCSAASYTGGQAASPAYQSYNVDGVADANMPMAKEAAAPPSDTLLEVTAGSMESDSDLWSGGEVDESFKKTEYTRQEAPPPPPAPGFAAQNPAPTTPREPDSPAKQAPVADPSSTATGKKDDENTRTQQVASGQHAPMLIYTGNVQLAVYEVRNALGEVEVLARSLGGFLANRNDRSITIRIPAAKFEDAMRRIEKMGDMISRNVQVQDVTEEFNDVEIRLRNARAVRDRLEQLLTKAAKVEESIQIERELERVALTIERLEGRMKFLKDRAAYSTITVTFEPRSAAELGKRPFHLPVPWLYDMGLGRLLAL